MLSKLVSAGMTVRDSHPGTHFRGWGYWGWGYRVGPFDVEARKPLTDMMPTSTRTTNV